MCCIGSCGCRSRCESTFCFVVGADSEVAIVAAVHGVPEPQRLIERERVVDLAAQIDVVAWRSQAQRFRSVALRSDDVDVGRVVRALAIGEEVERALLADERAAEAEVVGTKLFRPLARRKRTACARGAVAQRDAREYADGADAGLRDDFHRHAAGAVILGRELIARDADRSNLRFERQRAPLEAVDCNHGARTRHVFELASQLGRVVRECLQLLARERRSERRSRVGGVLLHRDSRLDGFDPQHDNLFVVPGRTRTLSECRARSRRVCWIM